MDCKSKTSIKCDKHNKPNGDFILNGLEETGRLQFFFHSLSSELPIRDILNEQKRGHKTEPHIEIGAENYINCCYQPNNIIPFLKSKERYLFLFTPCKCKSRNLENYYNERFIVGYIIKQRFIDCENHYAVQGKTKLYSFTDAYPMKQLFPSTYKNIRVKKLSGNETKKILDHFKGKQNILQDCVEEIKRLEKKNKKKDKTCLILRGDKCRYQNECLRWI